jgi:tRNA(Ile)-lysidine synthase
MPALRDRGGQGACLQHKRWAGGLPPRRRRVMPKSDLEAQFAQLLVDRRLLAHDETVVVGVSGGPDSVALLHLLHSLKGVGDWSLRLHVAHLNHQLRGADADADAAFVESLARKLGLPVAIESVDVRAVARERGTSVEQAGRQCRFEFLERLCLKLDARTVAMAHHADDNAETILHRIIRGTGLRGLGGIRPVRPIRPGSDIRIIRPLLAFRRAQIMDYLTERGIESRVDATNHSSEFTRNRIRNIVLPLLREKFNPQVDEALLRLGEQARGADAYLSETSERLLESLVVSHDDRQLTLHADLLARKPQVMRAQVVRHALLRLGIGEQELTYGHLEAVANLAAGREGNKTLDLPGGFRVSRRYARLVFEAATGAPVEPLADQMRVSMNGTTLLPAFGMEISAESIEANETLIDEHIRRQTGRGQANYEEWLDAAEVRPPLVARARKPGDRFLPLGMTGMKKLSDFFIDEKIDPALRDRSVVLCDQLGPIWLVPFRIDDRVRLHRGTQQILRLRARPLDARERT